MRLIPLTSSQLAAIGYTGNSLMAVQFQRGGWYLYEDVPMSVFVQVITDPDSQGRAFHRLVKQGGYRYRKTTPEEIESL
jgi:hypothetical protein